MSKKILSIEGIGPSASQKLAKVNIKTVSGLLEKCCTKSGRKEVAKITGISESKLLDWTNMADLFRVRGVGGEYAELLKVAGVDTVLELRTRNPKNLHEKLIEVNQEKKVVRMMPGFSKVEKFVMFAKSIDPMVSH